MMIQAARYQTTAQMLEVGYQNFGQHLQQRFNHNGWCAECQQIIINTKKVLVYCVKKNYPRDSFSVLWIKK